jgi:hypothetical protein
MSNLTAPPLAEAAIPVPTMPLPAWRMNLMRGGFLLMGVGLAIVKWPMLATASSLPALEGALLIILTAVSLLAFLGLRYPIAMLPLLVFEVLWKVLWFGIVALPLFLTNGFDAPTETLLFSNLFVIPIILVTPWDLVWKRFVAARGDRWTRKR